MTGQTGRPIRVDAVIQHERLQLDKEGRYRRENMRLYLQYTAKPGPCTACLHKRVPEPCQIRNCAQLLFDHHMQNWTGYSGVAVRLRYANAKTMSDAELSICGK